MKYLVNGHFELIRTLIGLRSILFLFIFCTHFRWVINTSELGQKLFDILFLGRYGVLYFFLLSGFCIAIGYTNIFSSLSIEQFIKFIKRRLLKIYPLYLLTGLGCLFFFDIPKHGIKMIYSFVVSYVPMLQAWGIFSFNSGGNGVAWFVSSLFFCYLLTPFILRLLNKIKNIKFHFLFCFLNYLILIIFSLFLVLKNDTQNLYFYTIPYVRIFEYMIGLDLGLIYVKILKDKQNNNISYAFKSIIDVLFVILFFGCIYALPNNLLTRHSLAMPLFGCFLLYLCCETRSILYDFFNSKFCIFIGNISYECFLIHYPILEILKPYYKKYIYTMNDIILLFIILFIISILVSYLYKKIQESIIRLYISKTK